MAFGLVAVAEASEADACINVANLSHRLEHLDLVPDPPRLGQVWRPNLLATVGSAGGTRKQPPSLVIGKWLGHVCACEVGACEHMHTSQMDHRYGPVWVLSPHLHVAQGRAHTY